MLPAAGTAAAVGRAPHGYVVSSQHQHVMPAQPGEVQPLQLGKHLELQVSNSIAPATVQEARIRHV